MFTQINSYLLYPVILFYISFLKGMKTEYKKFFMNELKEDKKQNILNIKSYDLKFFDFIEYFFDKTSDFYSKVCITFNLDISRAPEQKKYFKYDFYFAIKFFYATSILSKRTSNDALYMALEFDKLQKQRPSDTEINHLIRYSLIAYGTKMIDTLVFNSEILKDQKSKLAYETMLRFTEGAKIINFTRQRHLHVLSVEKDSKKYDIVWSSEDDIELEDFGVVYDKYGKELKSNIKITNSPIYALHK